MKTRKVKAQPVYDLNTPQALEQFRKAAVAHTAKVMKTRESALQALISMGIYTKSGKISKNYSR